ncbi:alanine racemase [Sandaracinobacter sp. RS1-74]|nr:alanine racemase [Sandaracinobacteroides sayramensis]MCG2840630.1 alanine racemase [Sandaracinobacteroides sayramensis]
MDRNIDRMRAAVASLGVAFRPHVKTAKSLAVVRRMTGGVPGPITVSTLREAEVFADAGYTDILYAVGVTPNKVARAQRLRGRGVDLKLIVDNADAATAIAAAGDPADPLPVLVEVDSDGHRAGVAPSDAAALLGIAARLRGGATLCGLLTHAGASYGATSHAEIRRYADQERDALLSAAAILREAGHPVETLSVGSTPTALFATDLSGITEVRAGVFVFFDLVMAGIDVCRVEDIALSVLASVIAVQPDRGRFLVDAGWSALSRDRGTARQAVDQGYGLVCDATGRPCPDLIVLEANQEHGVVGLRPGSTNILPKVAVGDLVRILPNHACATAGQHAAYRLIDSVRRTVTGSWPRFGGW